MGLSRIMGLDPGIHNTGYCIADVSDVGINIKRVGLIETEQPHTHKLKSANDVDRIATVMRRLSKIIRKHRICLIVAEVPIGGGRSSSAVKYLAMATAVLSHVKVVHKIPVILVSPHAVKKEWTGDRRADKHKMIGKSLKLYRHVKGWPTKKNGDLMKSKLEHPADAVAILFTGKTVPDEWKAVRAMMR